jgi:lipoyl-dependent peroxiredoxin
MALRRAATAVWKGALKDGAGVISTQTKVLNNTPYSFSSRFEQGIQQQK